MQTNSKSKLYGTLCILLATVIWGSTFVAQSAATIPPFTYQGVRSIIGSLFLIILIGIRENSAKVKGIYKKPTKEENRFLWSGGIVCGIILCFAMNLQQFGIYFDTGPGKAGFITTMYILIVPLLGIFMKKRVPFNVLVGIIIAVFGLFFLCFESSSGISLKTGDLFLILCAVVFAFHIVAVDYFAPRVDGVKLSCIQFIVAGIISCILMFVFENPDFSAIVDNTIPILYAGIGSSGIAYTLQIIGQQHTPPTLASLVMSFESVFAVLSQIVVMSILPSGRETLGCVLMFAAIIVAQLEFKKKNQR